MEGFVDDTCQQWISVTCFKRLAWMLHFSKIAPYCSCNLRKQYKACWLLVGCKWSETPIPFASEQGMQNSLARLERNTLHSAAIDSLSIDHGNMARIALDFLPAPINCILHSWRSREGVWFFMAMSKGVLSLLPLQPENNPTWINLDHLRSIKQT